MYSCVYRAKQYLHANSHPRYGLIVHSNGTRFESQRFKIERTGSRKYSGRSGELRCVSAAGELAARRAMPTSGVDCSAPQRAAASRVRLSAWRGAPCSSGGAGGQSGMGLPEMLPPGPVTIGARSDPVRAFGPGSVKWSVEWTGNSAVCSAGRRAERLDVGLKGTGDMAHLTTALDFAFSSPLSSTFFTLFFIKSLPVTQRFRVLILPRSPALA